MTQIQSVHTKNSNVTKNNDGVIIYSPSQKHGITGFT